MNGTLDECIFCRIVRNEIPASIVHEDELTLAFMDIGQVNPGHTIVVLKSHVPDIHGLDASQAGAVFRTATRVAQAVKEAMRPAGVTVLQTNGVAGWQTVFHFHIHVLPRHVNDGVELTWPAKHPARDALERYASQVKAALDTKFG